LVNNGWWWVSKGRDEYLGYGIYFFENDHQEGLTDNIANLLASSLAIGYGVVGDSALSTLYRHSFSVPCGYPGGNQYNR
jgi:hypothetical protein